MLRAPLALRSYVFSIRATPSAHQSCISRFSCTGWYLFYSIGVIRLCERFLSHCLEHHRELGDLYNEQPLTSWRGSSQLTYRLDIHPLACGAKTGAANRAICSRVPCTLNTHNQSTDRPCLSTRLGTAIIVIATITATTVEAERRVTRN